MDFIANVNLPSERSNPAGNSARNSFLPAAARSEGVARSQRSKYNEELPGRFFLRKSEPFKMSLFFSMMKNKCAVARLWHAVPRIKRTVLVYYIFKRTIFFFRLHSIFKWLKRGSLFWIGSWIPSACKFSLKNIYIHFGIVRKMFPSSLQLDGLQGYRIVGARKIMRSFRDFFWGNPGFSNAVHFSFSF